MYVRLGFPVRTLPVLALVAACGAPPHPVGTSTGGTSEPSPTSRDAGPAAAAPEFKSRMKRVGERFESKGHAAGRWDAELYANGIAESGWSTDSPFPEGAEFAMEHIERQGDKSSGPVMTMKKGSSGAWVFGVINARGESLNGRALESCTACHKDAPRDSVFPITK